MWNFQISNHWMESLDYRYHTVHANSHTCRPHPALKEKRVRVVVAAEDPNTNGRCVNGCMLIPLDSNLYYSIIRVAPRAVGALRTAVRDLRTAVVMRLR